MAAAVDVAGIVHVPARRGAQHAGAQLGRACICAVSMIRARIGTTSMPSSNFTEGEQHQSRLNLAIVKVSEGGGVVFRRRFSAVITVVCGPVLRASSREQHGAGWL